MRWMMMAAVAAALAATGPAEARPSTTAMTCGQAQTFLQRQGAAVIGTGGQTYDRFVADRSFCQQTEVTKRAFVATRDTRACLIGYTCREPSRSDWIGDNF